MIITDKEFFVFYAIKSIEGFYLCLSNDYCGFKHKKIPTLFDNISEFQNPR